MTISLTRLSGGNTPADGSDPRTFPAIWNASATAIEGALAEGGGASVTVSETAPTDPAPAEGDLWLDSTEAKMYVYYDDGTSAQWVAAVGGTVPQQGKILQVVSTTKTDSFSTTSTSLVEITGLAASITPVSTSSKILVLVSGLTSISTNTNSLRFSLKRDSTYIGQGTGGTTADFSLALFPAVVAAGVNFSINFLDTPSSTSALDYQVDMSVSGGTGYVGRNTASDSFGSITTITVMEVAG